MSNPFDWEHDSANEGLSALAADLKVDKTANLCELRRRLSVGVDHYGSIHGTVTKGEEDEREIYLRGHFSSSFLTDLFGFSTFSYQE